LPSSSFLALAASRGFLGLLVRVVPGFFGVLQRFDDGVLGLVDRVAHLVAVGMGRHGDADVLAADDDVDGGVRAPRAADAAV
jgi:hypothetical protein